MILIIKNMVCQRCVDSVRDILFKHDVIYNSITLGQVDTKDIPDEEVMGRIKKDLEARGFELLSKKETILINKVKSYIIEKVFHGNHENPYKLSDDLARTVGMNYAQISKTFSKTEGLTIEKYVLNQKIERVKELISYGELSLSEIADELSFSSSAHLSSQFKKVTGMTATEFKKLSSKPRTNIDSL